MPDPFLIERQFQTLKQSLGLLSSTRLRLLRIVEFVEPLLESEFKPLLAAYQQELLPQLCTLIQRTDFTGTNIALLNRVRQLMQRVTDEFPSTRTDEEWQKAIHHLSSSQDRLTAWIVARGVPRPSAGPTHDERSESRIDAAWIPMVEHEQLLAGTPPQFAALRCVHVEASFSTKPGTSDELHLGQFVDREVASDSQLRSSLEAAKRLLKTFAHIEVKERLIVHCSFDEPNVVVGESLQAGLSLVLFTELLRVCQHREEYALRGDVAVTGRVDDKGNILPVDEEGLKLKIEACTFSWVRILVVPKDQEEICRGYAAQLTNDVTLSAVLRNFDGGKSPILPRSTGRTKEVSAEHPPQPSIPDPKAKIHNPMQIIGASTLDDIIYNRRLTDSRRVPIARQAARKAWKLRRPLAVAVIVALVAVIGKMWYGPIDKNPVMAAYEGEMLLVQNKYGDNLEEIWVGEVTAQQGRAGVRIAGFYDVDGDGKNELIWAQNPVDDAAVVSVVNCKTPGEENYRWTIPLVRELSIPENPVEGENFLCRELNVGDFDGDGCGEVFVLAYHSFFPSLVVRLDAESGGELGWYVNTGGLATMNFLDLEDDGVTEVLLCGINNALSSACLAILDPRFVQGHSPLYGKYQIDGVDPGIERAYILFPRTIVSEAFPDRVPWNSASAFKVYESSRTFEVTVTEYPYNDNQYSVSLFPSFTFDLRVQGIQTGDDFDGISERLFREGLISRKPDVAYFEEYKKMIRYWDGERWQDTPVMNKRYLETLKRAGLPIPG